MRENGGRRHWGGGGTTNLAEHPATEDARDDDSAVDGLDLGDGSEETLATARLSVVLVLFFDPTTHEDAVGGQVVIGSRGAHDGDGGLGGCDALDGPAKGGGEDGATVDQLGTTRKLNLAESTQLMPPATRDPIRRHHKWAETN